jgi:hypothetical protein
VIAALWARFSTWIIGALGLLAAVAAVYLKGRSAGKKVEQAKEAQEDLAAERARGETIQEANDVHAEVGRLPADAVRERLRNEWQRD